MPKSDEQSDARERDQRRAKWNAFSLPHDLERLRYVLVALLD